MNMYDITIIGGGIVGLSTAMIIGEHHPNYKIIVLEKESRIANHQTGNNSGVIHSGIYYKPGSFKAKFCRDGAESMVKFCQKHNIPHEVCGKVIVATRDSELAQLDSLYQRGIANGIKVAKITPEEVNEIEPYVSSVGALKVYSTGIVDYKTVAQKYAEVIKLQEGEIRLNTKVEKIKQTGGSVVIETNMGAIETKFVINCGGLYSDRLAKLNQVDPQAKIIPFRGEYYELVPSKRYLVKTLIYPVPNPSFPFLGVHFTKMIDGSVHAGPNAVLSFKREGYHKTDIDLSELWEVLSYPGFWKLAAKHANEGVKEMIRSFSKGAFVKSLQQLIPSIQSEDIIPTHAGVRAQALKLDGSLVDDFLIIQGKNCLNVCNAPSPAATSSLEIGRYILQQLDQGYRG